MTSRPILPMLLAALAAAPAGAAEFDCLIQPRRTIALGGPIEALIAAVRVDRGDRVRRGDVLVEFDAGVERATAELTKFRAEVDGAIDARRARRDYAITKHQRRDELTRQNFLSRQDLDEAEAERRLTEAELREAHDARRTAVLEHRRAVEMLRQRTLTSPVNGVVVERLMNPGEVSELGRKPILRIAETGVLHVEVILPTQAYRQVAKGDVALVRPEAPIGGQHEAQVTVVDSVLDPASATFGVRLELPNADHAIPAGARCRVDLPKVRLAPPKPGPGFGLAPAAATGTAAAQRR